MYDETIVYTGLEIMVHGPAGDAINVWRSRFDPTYPALEPHISLAYPPFVPQDQWPKVKPDLEACLAAFGPFPVFFSEPGTFLAPSPLEPHVLWLKPEDGGMLLRMRQALENVLPGFVPPMAFPYIPHVSIGFIMGEDALRQALAEVKAGLRPFEFDINEVVYEVDDKAHNHKFLDVLPLHGVQPAHFSPPGKSSWQASSKSILDELHL